MTVVCPTCVRPLPIVTTPDRPIPAPDPTLELTVRLVADGATTVRDVASRLYGVTDPNSSQRELARRRLDKAVRAGLVVCYREDGTGGPGGTIPSRYRLPDPSGLAGGVDLVELLAVTRVQTVESAARQVFQTDRPTPGQQATVQAWLEQLTTRGLATRRPGDRVDTYHPRGD